MRLVLLAGIAVSAVASADPAQHQVEVQRALIQRDRQSAEFSRPELRTLHSRRELEHRPLRPDERFVEARERDAVSREEKAAPAPDYRPLPLPGGPRHRVDPIPVQGVGG